MRRRRIIHFQIPPPQQNAFAKSSKSMSSIGPLGQPSSTSSSLKLPSPSLPSTTIWFWVLAASLNRSVLSSSSQSQSSLPIHGSQPFSPVSMPLGPFINSSSDDLNDSPEESIKWRHPLLAVLFLFFCMATVFGNCLVVLAVFTKRYLRNPTGYLIVSLAVADLIVGLVVMPLNSLFEMSRHIWLLGQTTCDLWHALDILASTSSIWNLCVISLDRYMAGVDPIGYRDRVSKRRIIYCIFFVWMVSACISFPAIYWWRTSSPHLYIDQFASSLPFNFIKKNINIGSVLLMSYYKWRQGKCLFTDDVYYVVFSSLISFYVPLVLILFAYGRVYCIATTHSKSLKSGEKKILLKRKNRSSGKSTKSSQAGTEGSPRQPSCGSETLRIHFGQRKNLDKAANHHHHHRGHEEGEDTLELRRKMLNGVARAEGRKGSSNSLMLSASTIVGHQNSCRESTSMKNSRTSSFSMMKAEGKRIFHPENPAALLLKKKSPTQLTCTLSACTPKSSIGSSRANEDSPESRRHELMPNGQDTVDQHQAIALLKGTVNSTSQRRKLGGGVREKSRQMIKQLNEQRAARTLSIVVGVFILCWTPFFLFSPIIAICGDKCFANNEAVFSIITWAGHLNSMLNPLIYSRFSRDFRKAFKQILTCERERPTKKAIKSPLLLMLNQLNSMTMMAPSSVQLQIVENSEA